MSPSSSPSPSPSPSPSLSSQTLIPTAIPNPNPNPKPNPLSIADFKKPPPIPWTHDETLNLIQAYQEKWYSLKRGQLKASQWEEVAVTVAARCGLDEPSKSGTQCRHKIEKLRKRYRAEKQKPYPSYWIYFDLMDQLDRGPLPISAIAPPPPPPPPFTTVDGDGDGFRSRTEFDKRVDGLLMAGRKVGGGEFVNGGKRKTWMSDDVHDDDDEYYDDDGDGDDGGISESGLMGELAGEVREFAERFMRIERKKMEMMREIERYRMEMENKRIEMILVSQQRTVDLISKAFGSSQMKMKMKMTPDF